MSPFVSDLVGIPEDKFSHNLALGAVSSGSSLFAIPFAPF